MTDEQIALARRAVAAPRWRWRAGMLIHYTGLRCFDLPGLPPPTPETQRARLLGESPSASLLDGDPRPDLSDAATLGCILALYEETRTTLSCPDPVYTYASAYGLFHPKTLEALVHALEAP